MAISSEQTSIHGATRTLTTFLSARRSPSGLSNAAISAEGRRGAAAVWGTAACCAPGAPVCGIAAAAAST
jgi:hypothetical protein